MRDKLLWSVVTHKYFVAILTISCVCWVGYEVVWRSNAVGYNDNLPNPGTDAVSVQTQHGEFYLKTLLSHLERPWALTSLPQGDLLITQVDGSLLRYRVGADRAHPVTGLPRFVVKHRGHLFDVVEDPGFVSNGRIYLSYAMESPESGMSLGVGRAVLAQGSLQDWQPIFTSRPAVKSQKHFGGGLAIKDNSLYVAIGDQFFRPAVQQLQTNTGKIIRIALDGEIPRDNPFNEFPGLARSNFAIGFRNPQNLAVSPDNELWAVEHGPVGGDELNVVIAGKNYGWPAVSNGREYSGEAIKATETIDIGLVPPAFDFPTTVAPSGLAFYSHDRIPFWKNSLFVSSLFGGHLRRFRYADGKIEDVEVLLGEYQIRLRDVHVARSGVVYLLTEDGRLLSLDSR